MDVPKVGTAYSDTSLEDMYQTYQKPKSVFYVIALNDSIVACGGIAPLQHFSGNLCELQKMYVAAVHRGKGWGKRMIRACMDSAQGFDYKGCYLETLPAMKAAQQLYLKMGFKYLQEPLGETGHMACTVRMLKNFR